VWKWLDTDEAVMAAAVLGPLAVAAALVPLRGDVTATNAALVMTVVVVAIAAGGRRLAGIVAAVVATLSFDFFPTPALPHLLDLESLRRRDGGPAARRRCRRQRTRRLGAPPPG